MFSQTVEYSLRAMLALAHSYQEPITVRQIADFAEVPRAYLSKMTRTLVCAGLIHSQRGLGGGLVLTRDPDDISIWDIVSAVQPIDKGEECPVEQKEHPALYPLQKKLDQTTAQIEQTFRECTLGQLLAEFRADNPSCGKAQESIPPKKPKKPGKQ